MLKRIGTLVASAMLALVLMPAVTAQAKANPGTFVGCYGIKKKGNYNDVRLGVAGLVNGSTVAAFTNAMVSASCQRVNSLPVINMYIYWTQVNVNGAGVVRSGGVNNGGTKSAVHVQSRYTNVKCGATVVIWAKVSYTYYDRSKVRPFLIHGPGFKRC